MTGYVQRIDETTIGRFRKYYSPVQLFIRCTVFSTNNEQTMNRDPITYQLSHSGTSAATYYSMIAAFTDDVLAHGQVTLTPVAVNFRRFVTDHKLEDPRSVEEYTYELLNLGVLWRVYGETAASVRMAPLHTMARLGEWRKTHQRLKPAIDVVRGILLSLFLLPSTVRRIDDTAIGLGEIGRLVTWLEATGDFREDAFRYVRWLGYLGNEPHETVTTLMHEVCAFAEWFETESSRRMGTFTPNVDAFVEARSSFYRWREDRFACLRSRTEYHLNMVGAEIMNRAYRSEFLSSERKTVLAPGCMRARSAARCEGTITENGIRCTGCEPTCHVNQLREIGIRNGCDVMVIPHSTDLARWAAKPGTPSHGVIGVACLSVLVEGGWELRRNNVPAQCILLNQCGCNKHWDEKGFPTELDVRQLRRILTPTS
jgi:uncharacterized protein